MILAKAKERKTLRLDTSGMEELIRKMDKIGMDVKPLVEKALTEAGAKISNDTLAALSDQFLPAQGKYHGSRRETEESVIMYPQVTWEGSVAWIPVGFDFSKPGAGGYLISGTPKMKPDKELNRMYKGKRYMKGIQDDMYKVLEDAYADELLK